MSYEFFHTPYLPPVRTGVAPSVERVPGVLEAHMSIIRAVAEAAFPEVGIDFDTEPAATPTPDGRVRGLNISYTDTSIEPLFKHMVTLAQEKRLELFVGSTKMGGDMSDITGRDRRLMEFIASEIPAKATARRFSSTQES